MATMTVPAADIREGDRVRGYGLTDILVEAVSPDGGRIYVNPGMNASLILPPDRLITVVRP